MVSDCPAHNNISIWCGYCYANVTGRASFRGHRQHHPRKPLPEAPLHMALKKRDVSPAGPAAKLSPGRFGATHPLLWEMISAVSWPDGTSRVPSTLTIFIDGGCVKGSLNDKDQSLIAYVSADTVEALFLAIERGLEKDSLMWQPSGQWKGPKGKRGK